MTGTTHLRTTTYHPRENGMMERFHRQLKTTIKCHETEKWTEVLPFVMLGVRTTYKENLQISPAEMVFTHQENSSHQVKKLACQNSSNNSNKESITRNTSWK